MKTTNSIIFFSVLVIDQGTKFLAESGKIFSSEIVQNPGLPFVGKILPGGFDIWIIVTALFGFVWLYRRNFNSLRSQYGAALIVGGAASNIIDRFSGGTVTDFINIGIGNVFNVADVAIVLGMAVLLLDSLLYREVVEK